jgi:hypothetical protein
VISEKGLATARTADEAAVATARVEADPHRGEIARLENGRTELLEQATADLVAAREDARIVEARPGLLRRPAAIAAAQARRERTVRR